MNQHHINKSIVRDFYRRAIGQGDIAFAEQVIADNYIQHSPMVKAGKSGLIESLEYLKKMPKPANPSKPFMRLIADETYVVVNTSFRFGGRTKAIVDVFRLESGKIVEHWDAVQDQPDSSLNGNALMDGPEEADDLEAPNTHKKRVEELYQQVFIGRNLEPLSHYVSSSMTQHNPAVANGLDGLRDFLRPDNTEATYEKIHRIFGEGNFVIVQAAGKIHQKPAVFYDIFRVDNELIAEQWTVSQLIPEKMPHDNGML